MFAWQCTDPTGVENLSWTELPTPQPAADLPSLSICRDLYYYQRWSRYSKYQPCLFDI